MNLPSHSADDIREIRSRFHDEGWTVREIARESPFTERQVLALLVLGSSLQQPLRRLVFDALLDTPVPESIGTILPRVLDRMRTD